MTRWWNRIRYRTHAGADAAFWTLASESVDDSIIPLVNSAWRASSSRMTNLYADTNRQSLVTVTVFALVNKLARRAENAEVLGPRTPAAAERCYSRLVRKEDVIAFARRDWNAVEARNRRRHWAEEKSAMTAAEALAVRDELRQHVLAVRPDWPTEQDRRNDLASHIRLSEMLRRVKPPHGR